MKESNNEILFEIGLILLIGLFGFLLINMGNHYFTEPNDNYYSEKTVLLAREVNGLDCMFLGGCADRISWADVNFMFFPSILFAVFCGYLIGKGTANWKLPKIKIEQDVIK